jgi:hypothetical protein
MAANRSSNNSPRRLGPVTTTRRLGKPKTARELKSGSATDLEPIGSAMTAGLTRDARKSRS